MTASALQTHPPMFGLKGQPIPLTPEFAHPIAGIVVEWSRVELAIENDLDALRLHPVAAKLASVVPRAFGKRLELWRRSVRALAPTIEAYQLAAGAIEKEANRIRMIRNLLVHGLWNPDGPLDGAWQVESWQRDGATVQIRRLRLSAPELEGLLADIMALADGIVAFMISRAFHAREGHVQLSRGP